MKRKEVLETQQLNENPLIAALMGALVGAGIQRNVAQQAATAAAQDPEVAQAAGGAPAASPRPQARPAQGGGATSSGTLRRGSTGPQVSALQRRLGVEETGTFDDATEEAVRAFQQRAGIQVDGVVGGQTQAAFASGGAPRNAGAARAGAADFDYSSGQRQTAPAAAPAAAEPSVVANPDGSIGRPGVDARPNADQTDAERERAAAQAPNNGAPQANTNRAAGSTAPSQLRLRQQVLPAIDQLLSQVTPGAR